MGPKKKSASGKKPGSGKIGSGKKAKKVPEPFISKYPPVNYEKLNEVPEVSLAIRMDGGLNNIIHEMKIPINWTLNRLIEKINEKHENSCHNMRIFIIENANRKYLDSLRFKTFKEIGITSEKETLTLYYEFEPAVHPVLEAGLV
jgi:hypothetical protein